MKGVEALRVVREWLRLTLRPLKGEIQWIVPPCLQESDSLNVVVGVTPILLTIIILDILTWACAYEKRGERII